MRFVCDSCDSYESIGIIFVIQSWFLRGTMFALSHTGGLLNWVNTCMSDTKWEYMKIIIVSRVFCAIPLLLSLVTYVSRACVMPVLFSSSRSSVRIKRIATRVLQANAICCFATLRGIPKPGENFWFFLCDCFLRFFFLGFFSIFSIPPGHCVRHSWSDNVHCAA